MIDHQKKTASFKTWHTFVAPIVNICQLGVAPPGASAVAGWGADGAILRTAGWRSQRLRLRFQPGEVWLARWSSLAPFALVPRRPAAMYI